jgi:hypothetical protein
MTFDPHQLQPIENLCKCTQFSNASEISSSCATEEMYIKACGFLDAVHVPSAVTTKMEYRIFSNRSRGFYFITGFPTRLTQYSRYWKTLRLVKETGFYWGPATIGEYTV